jgi:hypothetical protein
MHLLNLIGGAKCSRCGFTSECMACFEFHHKSDKLFTIGGDAMEKRHWHELVAEVKKCIVLCACCHRIVHWKD